MPDFKITLPDGASYKVTAPDEGTAYSALQTSLAGQPKAEAGRGGVLPSFAEGFATGFTDIPLGIASLFTARPEETAAGKFSTGARDVIQDVLGIDPTKEATTAETGASALGSLGSFLVPGLGAVKVAKGIGMGIRGAGAAGSAASGLQGAALGAGEQAQRAMAQERATGQRISDTSRQSAQLLGGAIGLTELLPLQRFLGPLEKILAKVPLSKAGAASELIEIGVKGAIKSGTAEGAQEAISQLAQNLVEKGIYNPELDATEGLLGNAAAGGFAGGTVDAILQMMAGRKIRKATTSRAELGKQLRAESDEAAPERVRAEALDGVNTLRAASPAGTISVVTSQMPGDEKPRYHIVDANKKSIASFSSADAAILAGKQYEADSGGVSKFEPPTITERVKIKAPKGPKLSKAEKNKALQEAKRLKAQGALAPAPTIAPATTPEGQATTEASIEKVVAETPVIAPKKGRKSLAPTEAVVPPEAAPPVVTAAEITLPETPTEAPPAAELTPKAPAQPAPAKPPVTAKTYGEIAKKVPGAGISFGDFAGDFNLRDTVPYARIRSLSRKTIYQKPGERVPESEAVDVWGVEDPSTVEPREGPKVGIGEMDQYVPEPFRKAIRDFLSGKIDNLEAERQLKATPVAPKPSKLSAAPTVATEAAAAPAVPAASDVPKGYKKVEKPRETALKVAFRPLESTPEGAAKAAEMDAKKDRVAAALNKVLAPIVAKDVRLNLVSHITEKGVLARGVASPDGKIISLSLDIYDPALTDEQLIDKLMEVMNHEVIHTLTNAKLLNPAEIKTLFDAADKTKYRGKSFTYFDRAYATYFDQKNGVPLSGYEVRDEAGNIVLNDAGKPNVDMDLITEEAVAEMFRDYRAGKLKLNEKPKGIFNKIIQFFKRMFRGFRDAEIGKVFTRIESGEVGARQGVAAPAGAAPKFSVAPAVGSDEFKAWFDRSKVLDKQGNPLVVHHFGSFNEDEDIPRSGMHFGTRQAAIDRAAGKRVEDAAMGVDVYQADDGLWHFDLDGVTSEDLGFVGFFDEENALANGRSEAIKQAEQDSFYGEPEDSGIMTSAYLSLQNPKRMVDQGGAESEWDAAIAQAKAEGHDGIVYRNQYEDKGSDSYIAFEPTQIKSTENIGTFSKEDKRIKFSVAPSAYENVPFLEKPAAVQKQILGDVDRMRRKANDIAKDVARKSDTTLGDSANAANVEVRNAVRKLSAIPQPHPQSAFFEAANSTLFSTVAKPTSPGERIMDLLGGLGSSAGRAKFMDAFRVNYVQTAGQIAKYKRQLEIDGKIESGIAEYDAIASIEAAERASHQIPSMIEFGAGEVRTINGDRNSMYYIVDDNNGDDTPAKFFQLVETGGPNGTSLSEQFKTLLVARAVVKRQGEGKDTPLEVTPQYIQNAEDLAIQYPVLEEAYGRYQRFNRKLIKAAMDAGVISQDTFEAYTDDMNYYSMYREVGGEVLAPQPYGSTGKAVKIKAFKGSEQGALIADPMVAMIRNMSFWTGAIMRNIAAQKAHRVAMEAGIGRNLVWQGNKLGWQSPDPSRGEDERFMSYLVDGTEVRYAVTDSLFAVGLANTESSNVNFMLELLGLPTTALREMVTRDPGFMIANLLRDSISTWILAGSGANPLSTFVGMKKALMKDSSYATLKRMAVVGSYDEAQKSPKQMVAGLRSNIVGAQGITNAMDVLKYGWDRLGKLSDASDAATRIAVYEAAIKEGAAEYTAAYRALSIMNFSRRGASAGLSIATRLVPFLNARIQGFDVLYTGMKSAVKLASGADQTAFEKQRGAAVWYRGMGLMAGALALAMLNEDDEDYKQIPQYIRDANFLIPIGGSKFVSIPKPFEAGLIFGTVPTTMYEMMRGTRSTRSGIKLFTSQLSSTFGFNPMPQVALPIFENLVNADFYTGQPLISPGMQKLDPSLQYNASTSYVARGLGKLLAYSPFGYDYESGKFEGVSPIMIDNLITGYGGPIAGYVTMGIGGLTSAFGEDNQGIPVAGSNLPVIRRFFLDAQDKQPQAAAEAYELYQLVDKATRTASRLKKMGDVEALKEFREENVDILRIGKQVRKMAENLNNIRAQVRRLEVNTTMSGSEKKEKMRELRARELQVSRRVEEINLKLGR